MRREREETQGRRGSYETETETTEGCMKEWREDEQVRSWIIRQGGVLGAVFRWNYHNGKSVLCMALIKIAWSLQVRRMWPYSPCQESLLGWCLTCGRHVLQMKDEC